MKYSFYIFCFFFSLQLSSQTWFPTGAEWHYGKGYAFSPAWSYIKWESVGDSIILGKSCKILKQTYENCAEDYFGQQVYLYENNDSVFLWNNHFNQFSLLYDFNALKDSSWVFYNDSCTFNIKVDSVYSTLINAHTLKCLKLSFSSNWVRGSYEVIEYIGGKQLPLPDLLTHCSGMIVDIDYYKDIRCYQDSIIGFYQFDTVACTAVGVEEYSDKKIKVYPNPAHEKIKIEGFENVKSQVSIYDIYGKLCKQVSIEKDTEMDVSTLKKGMYFIQIYQDEKPYRGSFFKL
jgi:hypothetical protein